MTSPPPPLPPDPSIRGSRIAKIIITAVCSIVLLAALCFYLLFYYLNSSGMTGMLDNKFGDQNLKTAVALLELHKLRYGRYPQSLRELRFTGDWDQNALTSVHYYPAPDGSHYYVEVARGWIGKPNLNYPPEFWRGT